MYNSLTRYEADYREAEYEDSEGLQKFLEKQREDALKSYPEGEKIVYCSICNEPLKYNSINYHEGFHIDSCI